MSELTKVEAALLRMLKAARAAEIQWQTVSQVDDAAIPDAIDALVEARINPNTGERKP